MRTILSSILVLILAACTTPYQQEGFGGGFTETQLDNNVFRVSFRGNGLTGDERVEEMALMRSAEITLKNGFTHFVIIDGKSLSRTVYGSTTPVHSTTNGSATMYGNTIYGNATTTTTGGQSLEITRHATTNTIMCYQGKPDISGLVYDAKFVYNSLAQKYRVAGTSK